MVINMREVGEIIKEMGKEPYGLKIKRKNLKENIQVTGLTIKNTAEEPCILITMIDMMVYGKMIFLMVTDV
jgi:hypothetical protein